MEDWEGVERGGREGGECESELPSPLGPESGEGSALGRFYSPRGRGQGTRGEERAKREGEAVVFTFADDLRSLVRLPSFPRSLPSSFQHC